MVKKRHIGKKYKFVAAAVGSGKKGKEETMIYLDHAATTKIRDEVFDAMLPYLKEEYGNPSSVYALGRSAHKALDRAREQVRAALGARAAREIFFTGCGTESDNWAIRGAALENVKKGRHIITTKVEHHAVLDSCKYLEKLGWEVTYLDVDSSGQVSAGDVAGAIRPDTVLISVMFANNEVGTINPIREIGELAREKGILFHVDAVQAVGHVPIDVENMGIDMLSLSGHKFYAPKGVGALYIRNGVTIEKFLQGGAQERRRRAGTENVASIVGMGEAITLAMQEMPEETRRLGKLSAHMLSRLQKEIPGTRLNGHAEDRLPGNVNISLPSVRSEAALFHLDLEGIACSSGSACTSGSVEASHVLLAMGLSEREARSALRFTMGRETTREEIDRTVDVLKKIAEQKEK